jgi:hypothetical protein
MGAIGARSRCTQEMSFKAVEARTSAMISYIIRWSLGYMVRLLVSGSNCALKPFPAMDHFFFIRLGEFLTRD